MLSYFVCTLLIVCCLGFSQVLGHGAGARGHALGNIGFQLFDDILLSVNYVRS